VRLLLLPPFAGQPQHAALRHERLDARGAEFGRLLDQRIHAVVGRHGQRQVHAARCLAFDRVMRADLDLHLAATHALDARLVLAALAVEQGDGVAGLQPQHLHVPRRARRQGDRLAAGQWDGAVQPRSARAALVRPGRRHSR
jgi:hypothetical protein